MDTNEMVAKIGQYWDGRAPGFDAEHNTEDREAWKTVLARLLGPRKNASVVDLGTGTGFLSNLTAAMGFPSVGIDVAEQMLKQAVANAAANQVPAMYMKGNVLELPFLDGSVDCIVNARLIWTLIHPDDAFREWARVLKPGGIVLCFNRFKNRMGEGIRPNFYADAEVDGELKVLGASKEDLVVLMKRNGFTDVSFERLDDALTIAEGEHDPWHVLRGTKPGAV